ncbi:hypothetical protein JYU05_02385 [bacterium AH-315-P13]|nr:hypothetical protein [bacterium AH-315-P13]MBN4085284.1 hypothetical protein [Flavobacteriaceae bacterium AH-315-B10]
MKKNYLFFLFISISMHFYGQTACSDAHSDVNYAYSHVKSAYNSNNIDHLKYYSKRSLDAFERTKLKLEACKCEESYNYAYDASRLLSHVENVKTFDDGRYYVKRARDIAKDVINELELCTELSNEDNALLELQNEQIRLKQQQTELKIKEAQIKQKLAEREAEEMYLKKELFISKNEIAIDSNIKAYNDLLLVLDCDSEVIKTDNNNSNFISKNMDEIKSHYINVVKDITSSYLKKLNKCSLR